MPNLWIFGHSFSLPFNLKNDDDGWPSILAKELSLNLINFSKPAADNLFIYHTYQLVREKIKKEDIVIIGWSHPSRKSFVLDKTNKTHIETANTGLLYETQTQSFFRSDNAHNKNLKKWVKLEPKNQGLEFYDVWFKNYFSDHEQRLNFQSYLDSVELTSNSLYIPFYFSEESVENISLTSTVGGYMVEFIAKNNVVIGDNDTHMNEMGHRLWAEKMKNIILSSLTSA